ncbi:PadR family transcriptional regulator, partial [Streptomyces sp. SID7760]|nr:PadR family transcriptional regulator [Streptomyces sp. SID7760]
QAPAPLDAGQELQHVVLRGGIAYERMTIAWLDDVLATVHRLAAPGPVPRAPGTSPA